MSTHATHGTPPLQLMEDAVHGLRRLPLSAHLAFLVGTVPFLLGALWYWADMSRGAFADRRCASGALLLAVLYLWMKTWHAVYSAALRVGLAATAAEPWTFRRWRRCLIVQAALQPWGLLLVPLSLLPLMLPFPWVFAFFQHVDVVAASADGRTGTAFRQAAGAARRWPGQNHGLFGLFLILTVVVIVNVTIVLSQLPSLIKMFTGWESDFTLSTAALILNSTFLLAVLSLSYLVLMPLLLAVYARRSFEGDALLDGADLRAGLTQLRRTSPPLAVSVLLLLITWLGDPTSSARAEGPAPVPVSDRVAGPDATALNQSIDRVLDRPDFSWRTRRELGAPEEEGADARLGTWERFVRRVTRRIEAIGAALKRPFEAVGRAVGSFLEWILGKRATPPSLERGTVEADWMTGLKLLLYAGLGAAILGLGWYGHRIWRRRRPRATAETAPTVATTPDLTAEHVSAAALPETGWLQLARELAQRGEYRLAIRAVYLAQLAHLAACELVRLADAKSNRDYQRELDRRARALPVVRETFAATVLAFDRVWYGCHEATAEVWAETEARFGALRAAHSLPARPLT